MDNVHKSELRAWIAKPLKLEDMLQRIREDPINNALNYHNSLEEAFKAFMPDVEVDFKSMEEATSFEKLTSRQENRVEIAQTFDISKLTKQLHTIELQKKDVDEQQNKNPSCDITKNKNILYPDSKPLTEQRLQRNTSSDPIELPELLLTVQIYHNMSSVGKCQASKIMLNQEIFVIGHQFLTVLRDFISCPSDSVVPGDLSENPTAASSKHCKDLYKSGFFYIDSTFYNDFRSTDAKDYSKGIIEWAKEKGRDIGPFSSRSMEETRFIDLTIQLGYPYVYLHQGDCEHLLVFSDVRALAKDDCLNRHSFPMMSRYIPKRRILCMMCRLRTAGWVVTKHWDLPETPYFVCPPCFDGYFYTKDKQKVGSFEARQFVDRSTIV